MTTTLTLTALVRQKQETTLAAYKKIEAERAQRMEVHRQRLAPALPEGIWQELGIDPTTLSPEDPWGHSASTENATVVVAGVTFQVYVVIGDHRSGANLEISPDDEEGIAWQGIECSLSLKPGQAENNVVVLVATFAEALGRHTAFTEFAEQQEAAS